MNNLKKATLKDCNDYYFNRLVLGYLQPSEWEKAIKESTEASKEDYNGVLNYRNYPIINRIMDFNVLGIEDSSIPKEFKYRHNRRFKVRFFVQQCLEQLEDVIRLELPNVSEEELKSIANKVRKLQSTNETVIENINFEIVTPRYMRLFSENQFSIIIRYSHIQDCLISLDDDELKCFEIAFKSYLQRESSVIEKQEQSKWNFKMEEYIASLMSEQYRQIILEISQLKDKDKQIEAYKLLGYILDKPNYYNIQTLEDLVNLSKKKKNMADRIMSNEDISDCPLLDKMSNLERYRFIGLQHLGFYPSYELANMFDTTISESLTDNSLWLLKILQTLNKLYSISDETTMKNFITTLGYESFVEEEKSFASLFELLIKIQIERDLNSRITKLSTLPKMDNNNKRKYNLLGYKGTIYDATDIDFNFIMSSVSPYSDYKPEEIQNYKDYWNSQKLSSSAAYSYTCPRNLTVASLKTANLGFNQLNGLTYMCPFDLDSRLGEFVPKANNVGFMSTSRLADYQHLTEIDSSRISPDYIPIIKCWGEITNFTQALQCANDFSNEEFPIPIVFIDWDKIRYRQSMENISLILEYQRTGNKGLLKQIAQNMIFYQQPDTEIYGYYLVQNNQMQECLGNNSAEFGDYIREISISHLIDNIKRYMDYVKENNIKITLESLSGEEQSGR